jgi:hypothetical protein
MQPLLPCPFCGGPANLCNRGGYAWISCSQCELETRKYNTPDGESTLRDLWNQRNGAKTLADLLTELRGPDNFLVTPDEAQAVLSALAGALAWMNLNRVPRHPLMEEWDGLVKRVYCAKNERGLKALDALSPSMDADSQAQWLGIRGGLSRLLSPEAPAAPNALARTEAR